MRGLVVVGRVPVVAAVGSMTRRGAFRGRGGDWGIGLGICMRALFGALLCCVGIVLRIWGCFAFWRGVDLVGFLSSVGLTNLARVGRYHPEGEGSFPSSLPFLYRPFFFLFFFPRLASVKSPDRLIVIGKRRTGAWVSGHKDGLG